MKEILIKVQGNDEAGFEVPLQPGQTSGEVLEGLGLHGYILSYPNSTKFFGNEEVLYPNVVDGDKLVATTPARVGVALPSGR
jgi:hypothetical protein